MKVRAGSKAMRLGGWGMVIVGSMAMATGAAMVAASTRSPDGDLARSFKVGGGIALGSGLLLVGGGAPMVHFGKTKVRVSRRGGSGSR